MEKIEFIAIKPIDHPEFVIPQFNILELNAPGDNKPALVFTRSSTAASPQAIAVPIAETEYARLFHKLVTGEGSDKPSYVVSDDDRARMAKAEQASAEQARVAEAVQQKNAEPEAVKQFPQQ